MIALKKVEVDVSEGTFTLFLRYLYGSKIDVEEIAELEALVEIHSLACQFEQGELREEVVGKLRNLLNKGPGGCARWLSLEICCSSTRWRSCPLGEGESSRGERLGEIACYRK